MGVFDNGDFTVLKIPHFNEIQAFYTNGKIIIDDISPNNLRLDSLRRIRIIDCSIINKFDWIKYYES